MNDVNFVSSASRYQQQAMRRWIIANSIIGSFVAIGITSLQLYQWHQLLKCNRACSELIVKTNDFEEIMNKKQELTQLKGTLEKHLTQLQQRKHSPKLPSQLMSALKECSNSTIHLQSFSLEKNKLKVNALANQSAQITQFTNKLSDKAPIKEVKIISMKTQLSEDKKSQLLFNLEATIVR